MAASVWNGAISFGLLKLHQIHRKCHTRLRQPLYCPTCHRIVDRSEVVKGYEYEEGKYALVEDEGIKKIIPESGRTMEIDAFVKSSQIDPIYFESSYLALPEKGQCKTVRTLG